MAYGRHKPIFHAPGTGLPIGTLSVSPLARTSCFKTRLESFGWLNIYPLFPAESISILPEATNANRLSVFDDRNIASAKCGPCGCFSLCTNQRLCICSNNHSRRCLNFEFAHDFLQDALIYKAPGIPRCELSKTLDCFPNFPLGRFCPHRQNPARVIFHQDFSTQLCVGESNE